MRVPKGKKYTSWRKTSTGTRWECRHWVVDATGKRANLSVSIPLNWTEDDLILAERAMDEKIKQRTERPYGFDTASVIATSIQVRESLGKLRPSTAESYASMLRCYIAPTIGAKPPEDITPWDITKALSSVASSGVSVGTVEKLYHMLSGSFRWMVANGVVESNPVAGADKPRKERQEAVFASDEDHRRIAAWITEDTDGQDGRMMRDIIHLLVNTGLRIGEVSALRVSSYDPASHTLQVTETITQGRGRWRRGVPKSKESRRSVELAADVANRVEEHIKWQSRLLNSQGLIQTDATPLFAKDAHTPWLPSLIRTKWRSIRTKLGIDERLTPHSLRHTHVTVAMAAGANIKEIQERVGHSDAMTTVRVYGHVIPGRRSAVAEAASAREREYLNGA